MKVLVIKHSKQDDTYISALTKDSNIELVKLGYPKAAKNAALPANSDHRKIQIDRLNATDPESVATAAAGMDYVVDMAESWMSPYVKKGALQANVSYVNPKEDFGFWQQFITGRRRLQSAPTIVSPLKKCFRHRKHV